MSNAAAGGTGGPNARPEGVPGRPAAFAAAPPATPAAIPAEYPLSAPPADGTVHRLADLRLLLPAVLAWALVAALLGSGPSTTAAGAGVCAMLTAALALWWRQRRRSAREPSAWLTLVLLCLVATTVALVALSAQRAVRDAGPVLDLAREQATVTVVARVASDPRALAPPSGRPESDPMVLVTLDLERVTGRGFVAAVHTPVLVFGDRSWLAVGWHDEVEVGGRLAPTDDPADDVAAVLTARGSPRVLADAGRVEGVAATVRERFATATDSLPADARGLLPGLVIGDTSRTPAELDDAMLVTGMTHLSAVSGSNVAIVLAAALALCRLLGLRRRWRPVVAAGLLVAFVVLVRPEPSVLRAAAMGAVGLLGMGTSRRRAGIPALAAAILALLCWDPWLARSAGFVLSSLATLGLLLFASSWGAVIGRFLPARIRSWGTALAVPCAAQLMCAPVIVLLQGSVSVVGVFANLAAAPLVAPATVIGVATALTSVVWLWGATWLGWLAALPTLGIAWVARTGADAPLAVLPWPATWWGAALLAALSGGILLSGPWLVHRARRAPVVVAAVGVLGVGAVLPTHLMTWPLPGWQFVACDVGQGDALVLSSGPGRAVVVDAGPDPTLVDACLSRLHVEVVDAVVLTHFHADHVDGLPGVLRGRVVRQVITTPVRDPPFQAQEVQSWAAAAAVPVTPAYAGDDLAWDGIAAHVWWPERVIHAGSVPNNASLVLSIDVAGLHLLLLGDVEREAAHAVLLEMQQSLAGAGPPVPPFDVVKVAHHGSANRDDALLELVRAPVAVISVGRDNDYGHPAPSTVATLVADGYRVFRTDQDGDVAVERTSAQAAVEVATQR